MGQSERSKQLARRKRIMAAERQAMVLRLFQDGHSSNEIALRLGCTVKQVEDDIQARLEKWRKAARSSAEFYVARETEFIERVRQEALQAWERSQEDAVVVTKEDADGEKGDGKTKTRVQRTGQVGDGQFLQVARQCSKDFRELHGLDQPKRTEISGPEGGPIGLARQLTDDELAQRIIELEGNVDAGRAAITDGSEGVAEGSGDGATVEAESPW